MAFTSIIEGLAALDLSSMTTNETLTVVTPTISELVVVTDSLRAAIHK